MLATLPSIRPGETLESAPLANSHHFLGVSFGAQLPWYPLSGGSYLNVMFRIFFRTTRRGNVGKVGLSQLAHPAMAQSGTSLLSGTTHSSIAKTALAVTPFFLSRLQQPTNEHERSQSSQLAPVDDGAIYLIRAYGL